MPDTQGVSGGETTDNSRQVLDTQPLKDQSAEEQNSPDENTGDDVSSFVSPTQTPQQPEATPEAMRADGWDVIGLYEKAFLRYTASGYDREYVQFETDGTTITRWYWCNWPEGDF